MRANPSNSGVALNQAAVLPVLIIFALIGTLPFLWALATSLKAPVDVFAMPPVLAFRPTFDPTCS